MVPGSSRGAEGSVSEGNGVGYLISSKTMAPGCRSIIQGYWACSEGRPRKPPDWHAGHKDKAWIADWLKGWDDKEAQHECRTEKQESAKA